MINSTIFKAAVIALVFSYGCAEKPQTGSEYEVQVLESTGLHKDHSMDSLMSEVLAGVNCLAATDGNKKLLLTDDFNPADTTQILVVPFTTNLKEYGSSAFSDIENRFIIINPSYIISFAAKSTLNDSTSIKELLGLLLLHELGHFKLRINGNFDAVYKDSLSGLGEMKMNTEPEYLTVVKKAEMAVDSVAISMVKKNVLAKDMTCYSCASGIQLILPGMSFQLFGTRLLEQFGNPVKILRDPGPTHPNMELRIAFMNYYLFPNDQLRQMIDTYLYDREVAPVIRQQFDPRIYQGEEKVLPGDSN